MSHIIGRPNDDVLEVMLGHGTDPEQAFIGGSEAGHGGDDASEDHPQDDSRTVPRDGDESAEPPSSLRPPP